MTLSGKRILIVGGGSGIGKAVARAAIGEGADVSIASTGVARLEAAAKELGDVATAALDITDEAAVAEFFGCSAPFDHIVSTAGDWGKARRGPFTEMNLDDAAALFGVRFWGNAKLAKHGAGALNDGGSITLTSGMSAFAPQKGSVMATAMAGSIAHLIYGLAVELAPLRVNGVFPGGVATEIFAGLPPAVREAEEKRFLSQPIPRIATPDEVAQAYLYAMNCGYLTGQILKVDGGAALAS
jgi:NAD(P)-dependent dehydrogenase (short-subunit alcohol dehydrogenase family)